MLELAHAQNTGVSSLNSSCLNCGSPRFSAIYFAISDLSELAGHANSNVDCAIALSAFASVTLPGSMLSSRTHYASSARVLMQSNAPISNSRQISGLLSYMVQRKFSRLSAEHHPSSSRNMVSPPYASRKMCCSGTPVSVINRTSSLQQLARHVEQVTVESGKFVT